MLTCIGQITPGAGKVALAGGPSRPLPQEIVARAKTGFGVSTGIWAADTLAAGGLRRPAKSKSLISRRWLQFVLEAAGPAGDRWFPVSHA